MADKKISALTGATTPLAGTEVLPIVQSGVTKQVSVANLTAGRAVSATQLTLTTGNVIVANGQGIDFSANPNPAGMTSELLNDYEEGTWTPGFSFGGGTTGIAYSSQFGYYTKVGNVVHVTCLLDLSAKGSSAGSASITGLPFTIANNAGAYSASAVRFHDITYTGQLVTLAVINTTTVSLEQVTALGARSSLANTNFLDYSGIVIQLTYRVA